MIIWHKLCQIDKIHIMFEFKRARPRRVGSLTDYIGFVEYLISHLGRSDLYHGWHAGPSLLHASRRALEI